jgi:amino acid adenylation domain-containing protein
VSHDESMEGIAVIGCAGRFPEAPDVERFWQNLCNGVESVSFFSNEELAGSGIDVSRLPSNYVPARAILENPEYFDAAFFGYTPREAEIMDPQQRVFLETAWEALENAGYDPERYRGLIGVFAGMANNTYLHSNLHSHPDLLEKTGAFPVMIANEKDYLTTRVSYKLNLTGPSENINTACSTSLVAVCRACQSLLNCQCDIALAGGVTIKFPQKRGTLYHEGGMTSADGHCRAFDADATGMVPGEGSAIVVLKRLADAISDRDQILALVKGFAVNNDGSRKVGYTAPSVVGQAQVIALAQAMAEFDASTIGYVEAHGTATPLGDPIEIAALTKAFRRTTDAKGICAIGTVKSNIGHLDAAAGVAGLIKTVLALEYRTIPPSLHFKSANPDLNLAESPFFVNSFLRAWPAGAVPRRAGVSSFGIGGTNAHVVLEQAPALDPTGDSRPWQLLLVSAKTDSALEQASRNLETFLLTHPDVDLADMEYTLQVGRRSFKHRRFAVCADRRDAAAALRSPDPAHIADVEERGEPAVVFMFPGQGAQYAGMGLEIYRAEPVFRREIDACAEIAAPHLDYNLRELLYPAHDPVELSSRDLNQTQFAQTALFAVEYSLARLWASWGVHPRAMIGHSIGEYVAACLSGVFTLDDALGLVSKRGRLMQQLPSGAMLAVRLPESELTRLLEGDLSIAAINSPSTSVVSGTHEFVNRLSDRLKTLGVPCRYVRTSHAFHSPMVESVIAPFVEAVARTKLESPKIPFISNVTGTWIATEEATNPEYWGRQLREPVRFASGIGELLRKSDVVLLEVGPGQTLRRAAAQQAGHWLRHPPMASLPDAEDKAGTQKQLLESLGRLWLAGVPIDWESFQTGRKRRRIALPTYPFERKRYWVEPRPDSDVPETTHKPSDVRRDDSVAVTHGPTVQKVTAGFAVSSGTAHAAVMALLHDLSAMEPQDSSSTATFVEMGLDSLFLSQFSIALQSRFGVKITFRQLQQELSTTTALAAYIEKTVPGNLLGFVPGILPPIQREREEIASDRAIPADDSRTRSASPYNPPVAGSTEQLPARQQQHLDELIARYTRRTSRSKELTAAHRPHLADPRSVAGFRALWKEMVYPIVSEGSQGSKIRDVDGNEYIDLTMGFGASIFGHSPSLITDALRSQLMNGMEIGPQSKLSGEVARMICRLTGFDRATFCNTGSEAVLAALRIARTVSGRDKIALFAGSYHGIFDEVLIRASAAGRQAPALPLAPGIPPSMLQNVLLFDYGDPRALQGLRDHRHELAAVLVEPVQSRHPDLQPREFLHDLRRLTEESGIVLIFDEVITGFRCNLGGAQAEFGVNADICTYGKVIAGGMPIGVVAGRARFMDALDGGPWQYGDASIPAADVTYFAGTFVRHPLALATARAVLCRLQEESPALQVRLNRACSGLVRRLNQDMANRGLPLRLETFSSWFYLGMPAELKHGGLLYFHLREKGIHILEGRPCFISTAHTEHDLENIAAAFRESLDEMQSAGFLPRRTTRDDSVRAKLTGFPLEAFETTVAPLTAVQRDLWLASQASDDAARAYHVASVIRMRGELDRQALSEALQDLINRHDALRACMEGAPEVQTIRSRLTLELPLTDLSILGFAERERKLEEEAETEAAVLFDLAKGPLFRTRLISLAKSDHALLFTAHHIIVDGWSMGVLIRELGQLYSAKVRGTPCTLKPAVPFRAYAQWEMGLAGTSEDRTIDHWQRLLSDLPDPLELPSDRPRPATRTYHALTQKMALDAESVDRLKNTARHHGCTLFHLLLSSIHAWLHRLCGQEDFIVGVAAAGQLQAETVYPGASHTLVGHCVRLLPLRTCCRGEMRFSEYMRAVQHRVLDSFEHQNVSLSGLLSRLQLPRDSSRTPLVSVVFNLDQPSEGCLMDGLAVEVSATPRRFDFFDLHLNGVEVGNGLRLDCSYSTALFDSATIERWLRHFEIILGGIVEDPNRRIADLPLLTAAERRRILVEWNDTGSDYPRDHCIHELFQSQAERSPQSVAVRMGDSALTYRQLDQESTRIAHVLRGAGFHSGAFAGICVARSVKMVAGLLGILKGGGAYVPLDPDYPQDRLAALIHDAGISVVLTQRRYTDLFSRCLLPVICLDGEIPAESPPPIRASGVTALHPAYVMYTSGSTGRPKGVVVCHRNVARLVLNTNYARLGPDEKILQAAPLSFDASTFEIWGPLLHGGECVLYPEAIPTAAGLEREIRRHGVSTMWLTASLFNSIIDESAEALSGLRQLLIGGEALSLKHVAKALDSLGGTKIINGYGPTEGTTFACTYSIPEELPLELSSIPIGRPIANTRVYVLDRYRNPVPVGVPGEIYIGGDGVSLGYLNQSELTADKFVSDEVGVNPDGVLYRTGDLARYRSDGNLEFLGRVDRQLKIRGFRIEPEEIEIVLQAHPGVKQAVVAERGDSPGEKRLVAYVVSDQWHPVGAGELREHLRGKLPGFMIPSSFVFLDSLPRSRAGKIDWKALPTAGTIPPDLENAYVPPQSEMEEILAGIWSEVLHIPQIGIHDNFFALGGHSLLAFQIISRINRTFGVDFPLRRLFESPTVAEIAASLIQIMDLSR